MMRAVLLLLSIIACLMPWRWALAQGYEEPKLVVHTRQQSDDRNPAHRKGAPPPHAVFETPRLG